MLAPLYLSQVSAPRRMKTTGDVGFLLPEGCHAHIHRH